MRIYAAVKCGIGKKQCEDVAIVGDTIVIDSIVELSLLNSGAICIADGVGGNEGGYAASSFIAEQLRIFKASDNFEDKAIRKKLDDINASLIEKGNSINLPDMATTLTGLICTMNQKYIVHIGNTRAYILQGQYLKQMTTDHTVYNRLLRMGRIDEATQRNRNELTNCLGGKNVRLADGLSVVPVQDFNTMILTSDGIHDFVSIDELERLLASDETGLEKCSNILQSAVCAGSKDDMSVIIIMDGKD